MTQDEVLQAVGWTVTEALGITYGNHHYNMGGQLFYQTDGGPQGLKTAVEGSKIYMIQFDRKFVKQLEDLGIIILFYYGNVDDISICCPPLKLG